MSVENNQYQEVYSVIIFGVIIFFVLIILIVSTILKASARRFQHAREKADLQSAFEKNLLQSRVEIQEQAFDQISRELHDNIGQQLSLAKLNLNTLKTIASQQDQDKIESSRELISNSIDQIRNISKTLLGEKINSIGIAEAIKNETERLNKTGIFEVSFTNASPTFELNPQKEIILFRMVQETLNNIIRHAGATHVMIRIGYEGTLLKIFIQDNGKGFNLETERISGIGLLNMKNRAQTIGAVLNITSAVDQGTTVEIILESS